MRTILISTLVVFGLSGCGYSLSPKRVEVWNAKGELEVYNSCGKYMVVSSEGLISPTYNVTFTDNRGLEHKIFGAKQVKVSDIPVMVDAPMLGFGSYTPGERYSNADGTPGGIIHEGDFAEKGVNQAQLVHGKWTPVKIPNPACKAPSVSQW